MKVKEDLFAFYDFPAANWPNLRATGPIESTFATMRLHHRKTKGCRTRKATLTMVYKLCREVEIGRGKLSRFALIHPDEVGIMFVNGGQGLDVAP